jgi:pimeloyl-ACP methyl ester carboxylesterase
MRALMLALATLPVWGGSVEAPKPCRVAGFRTEVQCAVLRRALDPARPNGVQIDVHYVVVPALARRKLPDPVFFLAGGPGQSAIQVAPQMVQLMSRLNNRRDLVFVDQRGTGKSAPLMCEDERQGTLAQQLEPQWQALRLQHCLAQLQKLPYGDLRFFTTTLAMQDVDAVRQALGAPIINLVGVSYGTRAALEYQRQFSAAVRRSVIDGVAPPDMVLPASASSDNQAAFDALLDACDHDVRCAATYPRLRLDWVNVLAGLPRSVPLAHPLTGVVEQITLTRAMVLGAVRTPLYAPALAAALPEAITQAAQGRFAALAGLGTLMGGRGPNRPAEGLHFSVVCAEDWPRWSDSVDRPGRDFGDAFAQTYRDACAPWPRGEVAAAFHTVPASAVPVLLLSGGLDPVTPPRHGARVAQALGPLARHVVVPQAGHGVLGLACMRDVLFRFIDAPDEATALQVDASCARAIPRAGVFVPVARAEAVHP